MFIISNLIFGEAILCLWVLYFSFSITKNREYLGQRKYVFIDGKFPICITNRLAKGEFTSPLTLNTWDVSQDPLKDIEKETWLGV